MDIDGKLYRKTVSSSDKLEKNGSNGNTEMARPFMKLREGPGVDLGIGSDDRMVVSHR